MASAQLPPLRAVVSVLLESRWLDGVVAEVNEGAGEFLVEFEDDFEVPAWCSVGQQWRRLDGGSSSAIEPTETAASDETHDAPILPLPPPEPDAKATDQAEATTEQEDGEEQGDEEQLRTALLAEFRELHDSTVQTDGFGDENAEQTSARFQRLAESIPE